MADDYTSLLLGNPYAIPMAPPAAAEVDPKELERAKALAMIRMGLGVAGREPLGKAAGAGFATLFKGQADARAEAHAKIQSAQAQYKLQKEYGEDMKNAMFLQGLSEEELLALKVHPTAIKAIKYAKDPIAVYQGIIKPYIEPFTLSPGGVRMTGGEVTAQAPTNEGIIYGYKGGVPMQAQPVLGAQEAKARGEALSTAAKTRNTYQPLGKVGAGGAEAWGYAPLPPAMQPPPQYNFGEGGPTPQQQATVAAAQAGPQINTGDLPQPTVDPNVRFGITPQAEATQKAYGTKGPEAWFKIGDESDTAAGFGQQIKTKVGTMRDILKQDVTPQGMLSNFYTGAQQLGASVGINVKGLPQSELFRALTTQIALTVRNPGSGMGLPGAASDADFTRLINVAPNLSQSRQGQEMLIASYDAMSNLAIKKSELWANLNQQVEAGTLSLGAARSAYTKALTPYALEATAQIREAIAEGEKAAATTQAIKDVTGGGTPAQRRAAEAERGTRLHQLEEEKRKLKGQLSGGQ